MIGRKLLVWLGTLLCVAASAAGQQVAHGARSEFPSYTGEAQTIRIQHSVKAGKDAPQQPRVSITTVLDTSSSMAGRKLELMKASSLYIAEELAKAGQRSGVVAFNSEPMEALATQMITPELLSEFTDSINGMNATGKTDLSSGLTAGLDRLQVDGDEGDACRAKFAFILTDGNPTAGLVNGTEIVAKFRDDLNENIRVEAFALGLNSNYNLLKDIADVGSGESYPVNELDDVARGVADSLAGALSTVVESVVVTMIPMGGASIKGAQAGGTTSTADDTMKVAFPNLSAEEQRTSLIELDIPESDFNEGQSVLRFLVTYFDLMDCETKVLEDVIVSIVRDETAEQGRRLLQERTSRTDDDEQTVETFWRFTCFEVFTKFASMLEEDRAATGEVAAMMDEGSKAITAVPEFTSSQRLQLYDEALQTLSTRLKGEDIATDYTVALAYELADSFLKQRASLPDIDRVKGYNFLKEYDTTAKKAGRAEAEAQILSNPLVTASKTNDNPDQEVSEEDTVIQEENITDAGDDIGQKDVETDLTNDREPTVRVIRIISSPAFNQFHKAPRSSVVRIIQPRPIGRRGYSHG